MSKIPQGIEFIYCCLQFFLNFLEQMVAGVKLPGHSGGESRHLVYSDWLENNYKTNHTERRKH